MYAPSLHLPIPAPLSHASSVLAGGARAFLRPVRTRVLPLPMLCAPCRASQTNDDMLSSPSTPTATYFGQRRSMSLRWHPTHPPLVSISLSPRILLTLNVFPARLALPRLPAPTLSVDTSPPFILALTHQPPATQAAPQLLTCHRTENLEPLLHAARPWPPFVWRCKPDNHRVLAANEAAAGMQHRGLSGVTVISCCTAAWSHSPLRSSLGSSTLRSGTVQARRTR